MYQYHTETQSAIKNLVEASQPFNIDEIKSLTENILKNCGKYYDPIVSNDLKIFLLSMFEKGHIPGYYLTVKPIIDGHGPRMVLEFIPENVMSTLDLIDKPENGHKTTCELHKQYKELLKYICDRAECTQDTMIRSILVKALDMINDQLK